MCSTPSRRGFRAAVVHIGGAARCPDVQHPLPEVLQSSCRAHYSRNRLPLGAISPFPAWNSSRPRPMSAELFSMNTELVFYLNG